MPPKDVLVDRLAGRFRSLDSTRKRVDTLGQRASLPRKDLDQIYEALFLNAMTAFEGFLEDLFLNRLVSQTGKRLSPRAIPRLTVRSYSVAHRLVVGPGKKYADWLPYDRTIERAKLFFRGGRPFCDAPKLLLNVLQKGVLIRNVIAHRSRHSYKVFESDVIGTASFPPSARTPGGFLRDRLSAHPPETRYEAYIGAMLAVGRFVAR
jgi:hypothetical protein